MADSDTRARIQDLVKSDKVVLFMKGTRNAPQCGFSATVVQILDQYVPEYATVNVLADPAIREGVKEFANWPTIPQLYVEGEFLGGCDIVREMDEQGELVAALGDAAQMPEPPSITITQAAADVFAQALQEAGEGEGLRLAIDPMFRHDLSIEPRRPSDVEVQSSGVTLLVDPGTARRARGLQIDYVTAPETGFKMDNPNAPPSVQQVSPTEAKQILSEQPQARFIDVRTPQERETAKIEGTVLLTQDNAEEMFALPKDTPLVLHCHHGHRSHQAALHFLERGFSKVYNVIGGIDAWSQEIDPSIPRY